MLPEDLSGMIREASMRRKLFAAVTSFMSGIAFCHVAGAALLWAAAGFLLIVCIQVLPQKSNQYLAVILLLCALSGGILLQLDDLRFERSERYADGTVKECLVEVHDGAVTRNDKLRITGNLVRTDGALVPVAVKRKVQVTVYDPAQDPASLIGETVSFYAEPKVPEGPGNPRCFNRRTYLRSQKIALTLSAQTVTVLGQTVPLLYRIKRRILSSRDAFTASFAERQEEASLLCGILFGDTEMMEEDLQDDFRSNGTAHVLAVSGLHVGVIRRMFRRITGNSTGPVKSAVFLFLMMFYGTVSLWSVSVLRAVIMILLHDLGGLLERRYDLLTSLSVVAAGVLISEPYALFGVSFQMSFLAVTSISFFGKWLEGRIPGDLASMAAVQAGLIPYLAYTFNQIPLLAVICNIPVILILSLMVPLGLAAYGIMIVFGTPGPLADLLCDLSGLMIGVNCVLSRGGAFSLDVVSPPLPVLFLFYGFLFSMTSELWDIIRKRRDLRSRICIIVLILVCAVLMIPEGMSPFDRAELVMVDVGQGDCLHLRTAEHQNYLFDGGGQKDYPVGTKILKPYLLKNGVRHIDGAFVTHLHTDHYQGIIELCREHMVKDLYIYDGNRIDEEKILKETGLTKDHVHYLWKGMKLYLGRNSEASVLWPERKSREEYDRIIHDESEENDISLVFQVRSGGMTALITGDIDESCESSLAAAYGGRLRSDVLKVAHHGSRYSSCELFLGRVSPCVSLIGVGRNFYGHPTPEAIARLEETGSTVFRTDQDGAVGIWQNKKLQYRICTMKIP